MTDFNAFFSEITGRAPYQWQSDFGSDPIPQNRLIRIPTGFGKTMGVAAAWLYHRVKNGRSDWPRRLVWCLPMRTLVEQTAAEMQRISEGLGIKVFSLMGGSPREEWDLQVDEPAVLVGTQDILLSAALNRGYGVARARWPLQFGLLNHDCLWIMDEIQLMDVGLSTSAQLQAFRDSAPFKSLRPCFTWWMSATLRREWLESVDTSPMLAKLRNSEIQISPELQHGGLWEIKKPCRLESMTGTKELAALVSELHLNSSSTEFGRITLLVLNTVKQAGEVYSLLEKNSDLEKAGVDLRLVHSRFRGLERAAWRADFLDRTRCGRDTDRVIVSTQVVEAGVDISATVLITELAPWPSLVQRFGRAARYGGTASIVVLDRDYKDDKAAAPYSKAELDAARDAISSLADVGISALDESERSKAPETLAALYPFNPMHLLLQREVQELFDTSADLSGADLDISRFIRSGDERDLRIFWRQIQKGGPDKDTAPASRDEICSVPVGDARTWLNKNALGSRLCWIWDYVDGEWRPCRSEDFYPGQTVLVSEKVGGYIASIGWTGKKEHKPKLPADSLPSANRLADSSHSNDWLSNAHWQTISSHSLEVSKEWARLADHIELPSEISHAGLAAARWHDAGKAHPAFQSCFKRDDEALGGRCDWAKAPDSSWKVLSDVTRYQASPGDPRPGFRHELASGLAMFAVLQRHCPVHPALFGPYKDLIAALGGSSLLTYASNLSPSAPESEILALSGEQFDLAVYLVVAHHGKIRTALHMSPMDQRCKTDANGSVPIAGIRGGDILPSIDLPSAAGVEKIGESVLDLAPAALGLSFTCGASWTQRVAGLVDTYGPFALAYLEALLRTADIRASRRAAVTADTAEQGV